MYASSSGASGTMDRASVFLQKYMCLDECGRRHRISAFGSCRLQDVILFLGFRVAE
jgi:hypothetical protein